MTSRKVLFVILVCFSEASSGDLVVETNSGPVQGTTTSSGVEAFMGIPYAEPPIGNLRFAKTIPKKPWTIILNGSKMPPACPQIRLDIQYHFLPDITNMSEDCLYLNIWAPIPMDNGTLKPVLIYIHFGGFTVGSSSIDEYDGRNLAKRGNVIVATFNYRIGPLGYFLAYIDEAAGNMGMYDQVMAIKWLKENAVHFGGDPDNIVLMGVSSGATSVMAHVVSPISQTLFQKAIIQSGGITLNYFFDNNTRVFQSSERTASITGCSNKTTNLTSDPEAVVDCLKRLPVESLLRAESILLKTTPIVFLPVTGEDFLPRPAIDYLREGKFRKDVPVLIGFNSNEGTLFLSVGTPDYFGIYGQNSIETFTKSHAIAFARGAMLLTGISNSSEIIKYYLNLVQNSSSQEYIHMVANILGDYSISCNTLFSADFFSLRGNPVYFYKFAFRSALSPTAEWMGTTHLDELQYIFGNPGNRNFTEEDVILSNLLMDRWSNFAKTGSPNIAGHIPWIQYSYENPIYLNIEKEESLKSHPNPRCSIWRKPFKSQIDQDLLEFFHHLE